jgi:hypothetical protein
LRITLNLWERGLPAMAFSTSLQLAGLAAIP